MKDAGGIKVQYPWVTPMVDERDENPTPEVLKRNNSGKFF